MGKIGDKMAEIKRTNERNVIDYMARDYDSILRSMRELIPDKLPEWEDYESQADFGNVLLQLFAHMGDILSYYQDCIANESFLGTAKTRRSIIHHLRLIGYRLATAVPAAAALDITIKTVPSGFNETIQITKGTAFATKSQKNKPSVRFEYTGDTSITIDYSNLPVTVTIPVEEGRLIKNEILGTSDGTPNQMFPLTHAGLILRSLGEGQKVHKDIILIIEFGGTIEEWRLQETLAFSRERQKDFIVEIDEEDRATVIFGDGAFGAIPPAGAIIKATYRVGGGRHGNVLANTIQTTVDAPQLVLVGAKVTNQEPATGGAERENIGHAVMHAPDVFRSLKRAVTAEDYEALALNFKGVGKVRAKRANWNIVKLFVAPEGGGQVSDVLRANLLAYFEDKRPVSTIIEIEDVDYVKIYVTAEIGIQSYYSEGDIKEKVKKAAGTILAFDNVDFGQTIYLSKFYEAIEAIEGVEFVTITEFRREPPPDKPGEPGKIQLKDYEIPAIPYDTDYNGGIKVEFE